MLFKRIINAVVTIPTIIVICSVLMLLSRFVGSWLDFVQYSGAYQGFIQLVLLLIGAVAFLATFGGAVVIGTGILFCLIFGGGILWRWVEGSDVLQDKKSGEIVHSFEEGALIWRFDPVFRGRRLLSHCPI